MELLGGMTQADFLREYWQKKPLLIRQAIPGMSPPVDASELAGLACEEGVESRLVIEDDPRGPWQLERGPFSEARFSQLPESNWTLLVQGLDHWVPEVADLLARFRFIPNWRVDDIMASFAPEGGSVGPHFDQYDVFLLQAEGHREWRIGGHSDGDSPRLSGTPLSILAGFDEQQRWVLAPGDMLYLPPHLAHWGIACDDCITLSIGFRAPAHSDILTGFTDYLSDSLSDDHRYADPHLSPTDSPGAITRDTLAQLESILSQHIHNPQALGLWFGQAMTEPKHAGIVPPAEEPINAEALSGLIDQGVGLRWNEGSRFAYLDLPDEPQARALFVDGERFILRGDAMALAPVLADQHRHSAGQLAPFARDPALLELMVRLCNQGSLYPDE